MWAFSLRCSMAPAVQSRLKNVLVAGHTRRAATAAFAPFTFKTEVIEQSAASARQQNSLTSAESCNPLSIVASLKKLTPLVLSSTHGLSCSNQFLGRVSPVGDQSRLLGGSHLVRGQLSNVTAKAQQVGANLRLGEVITLPQTRSVHSSELAGKKCPKCQRYKDLVDFGQNRMGKLSNVCRACAAVDRAKSNGTALHHLGLSVEQAWANARTCPKCGQSKEVRDFALECRATGTLRNCCRACHYIYNTKRVRGKSMPPGTLLECSVCREVKPATDFRRESRRRCKLCTKKREVELNRIRWASRLSIPVGKRSCTLCGKVKRALEFRVNAKSVDHLQPWCKECTRSVVTPMVRKRVSKKRRELDKPIPDQ